MKAIAKTREELLELYPHRPRYPQDSSLARTLCVTDRQWLDWVRRHATRAQLLNLHAEYATNGPEWRAVAVKRALDRTDGKAWEAFGG
ncbi:MAG TPA: hypothetical protein VJN18_35755 [Polyangiaceae bacterium]|nr:hypothetical protein [Polyangiaceae bacterium]